MASTSATDSDKGTKGGVGVGVGEEEAAVPRRSLYNKQATGWKATAGLSITSLGIIYGDIGTSPLYVFNAIFPSTGPPPPAEDVIGAASAIIWSITIVAFIKYCIIALEFGNSAGEGGPFAIYTAIYPPPEETDENRALTTYTTATVSKGSHSFFERRWVKSLLFTWVLFGVCLIISDGLLTPAVSVVSAVGGIVIAQPSIANSVIPIAIAILVVLFTLQALGTRRVGGIFAPVIAIWLALNAGSGIYNITSFPGIFRAFDPSRAVLLFVRTGNYDLLSGVLLSITGVEAMVANLGQFSKISIRLGFATYVYPCLLLTYLGQGARLVDNAPAVLSNVFFQSIPGPVSGPFWWITWTFALMSSVIASQAMISATFSLVQQLTRLKAMPPVKIVHSSDKIEGQVFVPLVNFLCMLGTIGLIVGFGTGEGLTNAYGLAVSAVMIVSTTFIAIAIVRLKHLPVAVGIGFFILFGFVDGLFFGSATKKIPKGAWFPLALATVLSTFFGFWSWAKTLENKFDVSHRLKLSEVIARPAPPSDEGDSDKAPISFGEHLTVAPGSLALSRLSHGGSFGSELELVKGSAKLLRIPVFAFFHNASANTMNGAPHSFSAFLKCYPSLPQVVVFFNIRVVGVAYTTEEERYIVSRVRSFDGVYIATLRLGYRDPIDLRSVATPIRDRIIALERAGEPEGVEARIKVIEACEARAVTHILPELHVSVKPGVDNKFVTWVRRFLIESIYRRLAVNFVETDAYVFNEEDVLRMSVHAPL